MNTEFVGYKPEQQKDKETPSKFRQTLREIINNYPPQSEFHRRISSSSTLH